MRCFCVVSFSLKCFTARLATQEQSVFKSLGTIWPPREKGLLKALRPYLVFLVVPGGDNNAFAREPPFQRKSPISRAFLKTCVLIDLGWTQGRKHKSGRVFKRKIELKA